MTVGVTNKLRLLTDPKTQIFVSIHQPNLFAYGGVFKKIVLLQTLMRAVEERKPPNKFVNLFLIVDHDFMDRHVYPSSRASKHKALRWQAGTADAR